MTTDTDVVRGLRSLRVRAPESLEGDLLRRMRFADVYATISTPVGPMFVAYNRTGVSAIEPAGDAGAFENAFRKRLSRPLARAERDDPVLGRVRRWLAGAGSPPAVDLRGMTQFEHAVLTTALRIPRGEVRPYGWLAREIGRPRAVRAVGTALGRNPIPLVIPCHRVVRWSGDLGNYAFGAPMKRALLLSEGVDLAGLDELARRGIRFIGTDTTGIFCLPTCRDARRVTPKHRMLFRTEAQARSEGYRPCKHCKPALAS